ncbi:MAG: hypothetical protein LBR54_04390, partial [Oscillospiraceae bacterium]|nr:hypothetical protein [Oscillospiraceae bacterium]
RTSHGKRWGALLRCPYYAVFLVFVLFGGYSVYTKLNSELLIEPYLYDYIKFKEEIEHKSTE